MHEKLISLVSCWLSSQHLFFGYWSDCSAKYMHRAFIERFTLRLAVSVVQQTLQKHMLRFFCKSCEFSEGAQLCFKAFSCDYSFELLISPLEYLQPRYVSNFSCVFVSLHLNLKVISYVFLLRFLHNKRRISFGRFKNILLGH